MNRDDNNNELVKLFRSAIFSRVHCTNNVTSRQEIRKCFTRALNEELSELKSEYKTNHPSYPYEKSWEEVFVDEDILEALSHKEETVTLKTSEEKKGMSSMGISIEAISGLQEKVTTE